MVIDGERAIMTQVAFNEIVNALAVKYWDLKERIGNIGFKNQTAQNFEHLDEKYGEISKNLVALNKKLEK